MTDKPELLIPWPIGDDPGEADCSGVGYVVPWHASVDAGSCPNGSGLLIVRENELTKQDGEYFWPRSDCGQHFKTGLTLHSMAALLRQPDSERGI